MKIAYQNENVTLWHGDCREWSGQADAVVSDPPYPDYHTEAFKYHDGILDPIAALPCHQFIFWTAKETFPLDYTAIHIWDKKTGCGSQYERIYERNGQRNYRVFRHYLINSTVAASYTGDEYTGHPSQKPKRLLQELCDMVNGATVLDPFCGSGTTLIAALETGRKAIGIEIDERWVDVAVKRLERWHAQTNLFRQDEDARAGQGECPGTACNSGRDAMPQQVELGL